jgi:serine/threonine-protein kinase
MQVAAMAPPVTRMDYYGGGYPDSTQRMAPTMGGQTSTMQSYPPQGGWYDDYGPGYGDERRGRHRWVPWLIGAIVVVAAIVVAAMMLSNGGGGNTAFIPSVAGESHALADQQIKAAGFVPSDQGKNSDTVPSGNVISTNPPEGNSAAKGSTVVVYVSEGQAKVAVPAISAGEPLNNAEQAVTSAGLTPVVVSDTNSTQPQGTIDHTDPPAGTQVAPSSQVKLFVSGGGTSVPSVIGESQQQAEQALKSAGFTPNVVQQDAPSSSQQQLSQGEVWNQSPASGTTEPHGTQITIFVQQSAPANPTPTNTSTGTGQPTTQPTGQPTSTPSTPSTTGSPTAG